MLCTPGTRKSHGGIGRPSFSANGRKKPPRHASTWHHTPFFVASAAMSLMGSMTPCGYGGALPTMSAVFGVMRRSRSSRSTRKSGRVFA